MRRVAAVLLLVLSLVLAGFATSPAGALAPADADHRTLEAPRRLEIPALNVNAGIDLVGVRNGHLAIGRSVRDVYRWRQGVAPGDDGSAVLAGHTWSKGPGVFDNLASLRPGNLVNVGTDRFKVTRVRRVTGMSHAAVRGLFSDRGEPRLVLITCGDRNNLTGVYRTRIIVNAKLIPRPHR